MELKEIAQKYRALHRADGSVTENEWDEISEPARQYWLKRTEQLIALFESAGYRRLPEEDCLKLTDSEIRTVTQEAPYDTRTQVVAGERAIADAATAKALKWLRGEK